MSDRSEELVAVMLPRADVKSWADESKGYSEKGEEERVIQACKRALRPGLPESRIRSWLKERGGDYKKAADWIEYVLEHGWEVD